MMVWSVLLTPALGTPVLPTLEDQGFILEADEDGLFQQGINSPTIGYDPDRGLWHLYFESPIPDEDVADGCEKGTRIGHATSSDGLTWSLSKDAALEPVPGTDYGCGVAHPSVVYDGGLFHLFFKASDLALEEGGHDSTPGVAYAVSTDGHNFLVEGLVAENVADEDDKYPGMGFPTVVVSAGEMLVMFVRSPDAYLARSGDGGITWTTDAAPVLTAGEHVSWASERLNGPSMICHGPDRPGGLSAVIGGKDASGALTLGVARNGPGTAGWELAEDAVISTEPGWTHWDAISTDTGRLIYYSAEDGDGRKAIGVSATDLDFATASGKVCDGR